MSTSGFLTLGKVQRAHGLKGELSLLSYASSPSVFQDLSRVYLCLGQARPKRFTLRSARAHGETVLLELEGLEARQQAEQWLGSDVLVRKRDLPQGKEAVFLDDLPGCRVFLEDGTRVGTIHRAENQTGQEIWSILSPKDEEILFPVRDEFVLDLDPKAQKVVIAPPTGLLALYTDLS